jgi:predicted outer membrane repeat protein
MKVAGVSNLGNQASFVHCRFEENACQGKGGGFYGSVLSSAQLISCAFTGNSSGEIGGGIYTNQDLVLQNCLLSGNRASEGGGVFYYITSGLNARLNHCTFGGNFAEDRGGAVAVFLSTGLSGFSMILENSILWGNSANGQGRQIWSNDGALSLFSTCYADSPGDVTGQSTFSADAGSTTFNPAVFRTHSCLFRARSGWELPPRRLFSRRGCRQSRPDFCWYQQRLRRQPAHHWKLRGHGRL